MTDDTIHTCNAWGKVEYEYEVWQGDALQAGGREADYASAKSEANQYAMMYAPDGPVEVRIYEKRLLSTTQQYGVFPECDAQQPAAPSGEAAGDWVLVPRTPTDAMLRAAQSAWLNDTLRRTTTMWRAMLEAAPQQPAAVEGLAARLVDELDGLVSESDGVSGLHLNGDVASWDELLPGGRFERLSSLDELREALTAQHQEPTT